MRYWVRSVEGAEVLGRSSTSLIFCSGFERVLISPVVLSAENFCSDNHEEAVIGWFGL